MYRHLVLLIISALVQEGWSQNVCGSSLHYPGELYDAGTEPVAVLVGDVNGDCRDDAVALDLTAGGVRVFTSCALGFDLTETYCVGFGLQDGALVDLNGDGILDLVLGGSLGGALLVHTGVGDGTFAAPEAYGGGGSVNAVGVGDVDGDGLADVVAHDIQMAQFLCYYGVGGGLLSDPSLFPASSIFIRDFAVLDVDSDGCDDLVAVSDASGEASIYWGGKGGLVAGPSIAVGPGIHSIESADLNVDGVDDLVIGSGVNGLVYVLPSVESGSGGQVLSITVGGDVTDVDVGDLDGDGLPDILVGAQGGFYGVLSLRNLGGFVFASAVGSVTGTPVRAISCGDFIRGGRSDVVVAVRHSIAVLANDGSGELATAKLLPLGEDVRELAAADVDRDGRAEVAVPVGEDAQVVVFRERPTVGFALSQTLEVGEGPVLAEFAGVCNPDVRDLLVVGSDDGEIDVFSLQASGLFGSSIGSSFGEVVTDAALGDLDGDGHLDLVGACPFANEIRVMQGDGAGAFFLVAVLSCEGAPRAISIFDYDGDGLLDVASANVVGDSVIVRSGAGGFAFDGGVRLAVAESPVDLIGGDFVGGDGVADIVVASSASRLLTVFKGTGTAFHVAQTIETGETPRDLKCDDVDGDGVNDLIVCAGMTVMVFEGGEYRIDPAPRAFAAGGFSIGAAVFDVGQDGDMDLLVSSQSVPSAFVLLENASAHD